MIKSISLANLTVSPRNVRRVNDEAADAQLAADIAARGLLQNLVVTAGNPRGMFVVEAGGRRLRALHKLQFDGVLAVDHKVPCLVLGKGDGAAIEAGLAENFQRLAMNPADECLAFGKLVEDGAEVEDIARRFGLTVRFVEGRLRLANLAPVVFAALGAGEITLDAAKAYAATSDQERQAYVFEQLTGSWGSAYPDSIRRMMVHATVPASDRRFLFVGEEAYVAAGGRIERDLFEDERQARVLDIALLERLATEKLEAEAEHLRAEFGYAFVRPTLDAYVQPWANGDLRRVAVDAPQPSDEERQQIAALENEIAALEAIYEDEDANAGAMAEAEAQIAALNARIEAIFDKPVEIDPELKPSVGAFLMLDQNGEPKLDGALYARDDKDGGVPAGERGRSEAAMEDPDPSDGGSQGSAAANSPSAPKPPKLAQRLADELAMQRRDILALHVAREPFLALDLAVVLMAAEQGGYLWEPGGSTLSARLPFDPVLDSAMPAASPAIAEAKAKVSGDLDRSWLEAETLEARFDAFRTLTLEKRMAWFAHLVASTLKPSVFGLSPGACGLHDHLGQVLGIDVAQWWRPTALNWFDRVSKAQCLDALREVGGEELAQRHAKSKKAEIAQACENVFSGRAIVEAGVRGRSLAWVPDPMRFDDGSPPWEVGPETDHARPGSEDTASVSMVIAEDPVVSDCSDVEADAALDVVDGARDAQDARAFAVEPGFAVHFECDDPDLGSVDFVFGDGEGDDPLARRTDGDASRALSLAA